MSAGLFVSVFVFAPVLMPVPANLNVCEGFVLRLAGVALRLEVGRTTL